MGENVVVALMAGLFGLLPVLMQWMSDRSKSKGRDRQIARLHSELEFLEQWATLSGSADSSGESNASPGIQLQLDRLLAQYDDLKHKELHPEEKSTEVSLARRIVLAYSPSGGLAWVVHTLFYVLFFFSLAMLVSEIPWPLNKENIQKSEFGVALGAVMMFFALPLLILQRIAERLRRRAIEAKSPAADESVDA